MMRCILALLLCPALWGAACTVATSGNFADRCADGDTVTIANGVTLTVPAGTTAIVGASPADDTGTPALQCASTSGTGVLAVSGTLKWRGPVRQCNATWTFAAGSTLTYDAMGAATPSTALYTWQFTGSSLANAKLVFGSIGGARVTVNSTSNIPHGGFGNMGTQWVDGGRIEAANTDFSYQGGGAAGTFVKSRLTSAVNLYFDGCTIDHCGQINITVLGATANVHIKNTRIANPTYSFTVQTDASIVRTTGERLIANSHIQGKVYISAAVAGSQTGFTIRDTVASLSSFAAPGGLWNFPYSGGVESWANNLLSIVTDSTSADGILAAPNGNLAPTYVYRQANPAVQNPHPLYLFPKFMDTTFDGWIWQYTGADDAGDMVQISSDSAVARKVTIQNSIALPNAAGNAVGPLINNTSGVAMTNTRLYFRHNTVAVSATGFTVYGIGCETAGTSFPAGAVQEMVSNIFWRPASGTGIVTQISTGCTLADGAYIAPDYNAVHNVTGSLYPLASAKYNGTPGAHDVIANPQFRAATRSLLNFDRGYLGQPLSAAWATTTAYAVDDVVSHSAAAFFGGNAYNYRCTAAHTSGATTEPGAGSGWASNWEPAAIQLISNSVVAGTTYGVTADSAVGALMKWVADGYTPTNAALAFGADGHAGAMPVVAASSGNSLFFSIP